MRPRAFVRSIPRYLVAMLGIAGPAWGAAAKPQNPLAPLILLAWLPAALVLFTALELVLWVLVPTPLLATGRVIERGRGRCLLIGLMAAGVMLALLSLSNQYPAVGKTLVPLVLGVIALGSLTGITAVTALLGQGALDLADRTGSRALAVMLGSLLFGLVILVPFVGQVLGLYFLLVGLGGALQALTRSEERHK